MEFQRNNISPRNTDLPKDSASDIYRVNNGMPLQGHGPERFLASKAPIRKNKDYRPRFRNFSFGFPVNKNIKIKIRLTKKIITPDISPTSKKFFKTTIPLLQDTARLLPLPTDTQPS
jgi:hypothetical protein